MATTHPVQITIGATLAASLGAAVSGAQAQLGRLGAALSELNSRRIDIQQLEKLRAQAAESAAAVQAAQQRVAAAQEAIAARGGQATARQARELERAQSVLARAAQAYQRHQTAIEQLSASLERAGVNTRALGNETARLGAQYETLNTRLNALTQAQQAHAANLEQRSAYRAQLMDAVALGSALYGLVKPAVQFESVMADVKKVVDFETPAQFRQMSEDVLTLSTRIPMAAEGIGAIVAAAGQAGIAREELVRFAEDAAKMGVAFDLSGQQAGAAMTGLRTIFGLSQDEVVKLGDAINHLSNHMDARAADLLDIANRAGSTAKLFGLSGQQLNALGATFLALKTPPEVAATGINALLMKLATADQQGAKFQAGLESLGITAEQLKERIGRDAQGALIAFLEQVRGAPDVMGTLAQLFGAEYADDIAKLVGSLDTYQQAVGLVAHETAYLGSMQKEYEARSATTANNIQLLQNQMSRLGITIGNALLPALNALVGALMGPIEGLTQLAQRYPGLTQAIVGTVAAVAACKIATIGLGYAWTFVKGPILAAGVAIQSARAGLALLQAQTVATGASAAAMSPLAMILGRIKTAAAGIVAPIGAATTAMRAMIPTMTAMGAALLANPITWIVASIGAAVAGLALVIRKYWDPLAAYVSGVWEGIRSAMAPAIQSVSAALAPLAPVGQAIGSVFGVIADGASRVIRWFGELLTPVTLTQSEFESISASGRSLGEVIGSVLAAAFTALTMPMQAVGTVATWVIEGFRQIAAFSPLDALPSAWQAVSTFFGTLWQQIISGAQTAMQHVASALGSLAPVQAIQQMIGSIVQTLSNLPSQMISIGASIIDGLVSGIKQAAQGAIDAIGNMAASVRDRFKSMLGIHSPSQVFAALGSAISMGLAQGVAASTPEVLAQVGQLAQSMAATPMTMAAPHIAPLRPSPAQHHEHPTPAVPMPAAASTALSLPAPMPVTAGPGAGTTIHYAPQITINMTPQIGGIGGGADPQALANLIESRLRQMTRELFGRPTHALYDY